MINSMLSVAYLWYWLLTKISQFRRASVTQYLANTRRWLNVVSMLARRLRRRPNNKTTLGQRLVFAGYWAVKHPQFFEMMHVLQLQLLLPPPLRRLSTFVLLGPQYPRYKGRICLGPTYEVSRYCLLALHGSVVIIFIFQTRFISNKTPLQLRA